MSMKIDSSVITQKQVEICFNANEKTEITLTRYYSSWKFAITDGKKELTVRELIEICDLIYSEKVIDEKEGIVIPFDSKDPTCIRGPKLVTSEILRAVKVTLPEKDK